MKVSMPCKQAAALLSQAQDRPLTWLEKPRLRWHLVLCDACTNYRAQLEVLRAASRRVTDDITGSSKNDTE